VRKRFARLDFGNASRVDVKIRSDAIQEFTLLNPLLDDGGVSFLKLGRRLSKRIFASHDVRLSCFRKTELIEAGVANPRKGWQHYRTRRGEVSTGPRVVACIRLEAPTSSR